MHEVTAVNFLLLAISGWVNRRQLATIEYLQEEDRVLREQLGGRRLRFTDAQRRRLAAKGKVLGLARLRELGTIVTSDTILDGIEDSSRRSMMGPTAEAPAVRASPTRSANSSCAWPRTTERGVTRESSAR